MACSASSHVSSHVRLINPRTQVRTQSHKWNSLTFTDHDRHYSRADPSQMQRLLWCTSFTRLLLPYTDSFLSPFSALTMWAFPTLYFSFLDFCLFHSFTFCKHIVQRNYPTCNTVRLCNGSGSGKSPLRPHSPLAFLLYTFLLYVFTWFANKSSVCS